jgi:hypothetical protein
MERHPPITKKTKGTFAPEANSDHATKNVPDAPSVADGDAKGYRLYTDADTSYKGNK